MALLVKLCGRFGSEHDAERAAAALKADNLRRESGMTWEGLLGVGVVPAAMTTIGPPKPQRDDWDIAQRHRASLRPWEESFVARAALRATLTSGEGDYLAQIAAGLRARGLS